MISGLWNGMSGINSFEKALTSESNNIANVNTVGYKSNRATFADLMYQNGYGKGTNIQSINKNYSQGDLKATKNNFDIAINGKGFFIVDDPNTNSIYYTRAGNFHMSLEGILQNANNMNVQGIQNSPSKVITSNKDDIKFTNEFSKFIASKTIYTNDMIQTINTKITDFNKSVKDTGVSGKGFKTAASNLSDIKALISNYKNSLELYASNPTAPSKKSIKGIVEISYNNIKSELQKEKDFIEVTINGTTIKQNFDTNIQTTMNNFSDKISNIQGVKGLINDKGKLNIISLIPGKDLKVENPAINSNLASMVYLSKATKGEGYEAVVSARNELKGALENIGAKFMEITTNLNLANKKNLTTTNLQLNLDNLNLSDDIPSELITKDGNIFIKDGDNNFVIGRISTAYFNDISELSPQGDNLYSKTKNSGEPIEASNMNNLQGGTLELSNSNLANSLTDLMVYQKTFEANSRSITTCDELLKTAIALKKR